MILVDTSVWVDYFHGKKAAHCTHLKAAIHNNEDLCVCGIVMTEILQGIRKDTDCKKVQQILDDLLYLPAQKSTYLSAAKMYRSLRKKGRTIRKPVDCIIASICIENSSFLLHNDKDFEFIAEKFPLQRYKVQ